MFPDTCICFNTCSPVCGVIWWGLGTFFFEVILISDSVLGGCFFLLITIWSVTLCSQHELSHSSCYAFSTTMNLNPWKGELNKYFLSCMLSARYFVTAMGKVALVLVSSPFIKLSATYLIWRCHTVFFCNIFTDDIGLRYWFICLIVLTTYVCDDSYCMLFTNGATS